MCTWTVNGMFRFPTVRGGRVRDEQGTKTAMSPVIALESETSVQMYMWLNSRVPQQLNGTFD